MLTAIGGSSVTVRGTDGSTATIAVDDSTQIQEDGQTVALSSLKTGDAVLVHVITSGTSAVAERVLVGTSATSGPGRAAGYAADRPPAPAPSPTARRPTTARRPREAPALTRRPRRPDAVTTVQAPPRRPRAPAGPDPAPPATPSCLSPRFAQQTGAKPGGLGA